MTIHVRLLTADDLRFADSLRAAEGWNQTLADWRRLLAHQPDGCFLALWNGQPAGVVTTTVHDVQLGWIGMMLVDSRYRRRGLASALIERCLEYFQALRVPCVKLDATPAGEPVYERLGFRGEWPWQRRRRDGASGRPVTVNQPAALPRFDWDAEVFGADRRAWLQRVAGDSRVVLQERGFGMLRGGSQAAYLGPVAAVDTATAERIVRELLTPDHGACIWDLPAENTAGIQLAESLGFEAVRDLHRMWTGELLLRGEPQKQYGFSDPGAG